MPSTAWRFHVLAWFGWALDPPVNGANDIRQAMPLLLKDKPLHLIEPGELVDIVVSAAPGLVDWASQIRAKYFL